MRGYVRAINAISRLCGRLSMLLLLAAVLVMCQMIFQRYVMNASTVWQTEFVIYSTTAAIFLGAPYVLMLKGHVGVDLLSESVGPGLRKLFEIVAALVSMLFIAAMLYSSTHYLIEIVEGGWRTDTVWALPLWIPVWPLPAAMLLLLLQYVADIAVILNPSLDAGRRP